ncbi:type I pullulanase [Natronospora cellulosivora (SeqCode)]
MEEKNDLLKVSKFDLEMANELVHDDTKCYYGDDLGVICTKEQTSFRLWAPTADEIIVFIYTCEEDEKPFLIQNLKKDINGTWNTEITGDLHGKYYIYKVIIGEIENMVLDPYTRGVGTNSRLGLIVDLKRTDPINWSKDKRVKLSSPQDAVIYEVHVADFSSSPNSGIKFKGKYLAFTELNTVNDSGLKSGISHLKELGITHLHLQPIFDFATVDDNSPSDYNWGYDPYFYNVPEGSYASSPIDETRILELKKMIQFLHQNGIGVIMDVVYNHTYHTLNSPFNKIVPYYYYRMNHYGGFSNGSGTGNEIASEKAMVRKFILDSVKYWAKEYHIDGFRFDLMALHDRISMKKIQESLHAIDSSILIYGEPWTGGVSPLRLDKQFLKGAQKGMKIAVFNDHFRNAIKGDNDGDCYGFVSGCHHQKESIKRGVVAAIDYNDQIKDFTSQPWEVINYVSSHDNLTLWDKLLKSNSYDSEEIRIKMDRLAQGIILTSQGIPFIHGGEEILRTKYGNHNSYNAGHEVNQIKWERKKNYYDTFLYYKGLIKLRKRHPAFRLKNAEEIRNCLTFLPTNNNTVAFLLEEYANGDSWRRIAVCYNPNRKPMAFSLPYKGIWNVVVDDCKAGNEIIYSVNSTVKNSEIFSPAISLMVLYQS